MLVVNILNKGQRKQQSEDLPLAVTPAFIDELRNRLTLSDLVGKRVKLVPKGGRLAGLCPFHNEKTPSFYVNDTEGFYHCFGCGANGDMISWLRETDGLEFIEAVRQLSEMAGLPLPADERASDVAAQKRKAVIDACEAAVGFFASQLHTKEGAAALRYIQQRGLSDDVIADFRLGYAPRSGLFAHLQQRELPSKLIKSAGLAGVSERDGSVYDYFRDRLIFPIEDPRGRVIGFGARALGEAKPKYLNSPESPSFVKKSVLYGWGRARAAARRGLPVMVVEGYMDVIAVASSGVAAAVAPLGTALGEEQFRLLWKLSDDPVLCFDGDKAGQTAAQRAIERVLPLLEPGRSVRIAVLTEGQDPDDVLRQEGPDGLRRILLAANGLLDSLWASKAADYQLDNPRTQAGAKAAFWQDMRGLVRSITHHQTRSAWADELERRITAMRANTRTAVKGRPVQMSPVPPMHRPQTGRHVQIKAVLALLIHTPALFSDYAEALAMLDFNDDGLNALKNALIDRLVNAPDLDAAALRHHLEIDGHAHLLSQLFGTDMSARLGGLVNDKKTGETNEARVRAVLDEMTERLARNNRRGL